MLHFLKDLNREAIQSEALKQYLKIKDEDNKNIILFQIGHFYLSLFEDAKIISDVTGLPYGSSTFRGVGAVAQCGIPDDSTFNIHLKQILNKNYKVSLYLEYKDENDKTYRKHSRTYTNGTLYETELLESTENNYILALSKSKNDYKLAYADVSTGQIYQTTGDLSEIKIEIEKIEPCEILITQNLIDDFKKILTKYHTTFLEEDFSCKNPTKIIENYCKKTQKAFCTKLDDIINYNINNYLLMDEVTRHCLELTRTRRFLKKKGSIFWFLNNAKTPMGIRLLKKYISEPLLSTDKIKQRQEAVCELSKNKALLEEFEKIMLSFCDLSRGCTKISNQTVYPKDLLSIAQNSTSMENLQKACRLVKSELLKLNDDKMEEIISFSNEVESAISENATNDLHKGGIIKPNYSANLDYLKEELDNVKEKISAFEEKEKKRLNIANLKISKTGILGFYIEVTNANSHKVSNDYFRKNSNSKVTRYTTQKLQELEKDYCDLIQKINDYEYELFCELRKQAIEFVDSIRSIAHEIAQIDVIVSLARCAVENNLVKPSFNEEGIFIKDGFHPSLLKLKNEIIKNDTNISNEQMIILTGANMSGKSTYLKHNAIIALLSQIGSFVPASCANITISDRIFVRQGSTDDIINNNSTFMVEMNDLKYILDNITNSSLILLDEPAKSTSAAEGGAIARAFCEYLIKHTKAKVIVATHNLELTKIEKAYPNRAFNYAIGSSNSSETQVNDRKIKRGTADSSFAINTAILAELPEEIVNLAQKYASI